MDKYLQQLTVERAERRIALRSPAKINLFLEPLAKRPDGYHEIVTVMQAIDLCDEVAIELTDDGIELECDYPDVPSGPENLAWRAAEAFTAAAHVEPGARIRLTKRIPPGGGLGGGSSNAAVVLLGLNELTGRPFSPTRLAEIAATLGSDVPFFVYGGTALCTGRGELVEPLEAAPEFWVVLVTPAFSVATAEAYKRFTFVLTHQHSPDRILASVKESDLRSLLGSLHNGLAKVVLSAWPSLRALWKEVVDAGLPHPQLSGSGSTLYGVCCTEAEAARVSARLRGRLPSEVSVAVARNRLASAKEDYNADHRSQNQSEGGGQ
ncbi:MAG: 4-(cytidine 5'-diphospho)-2-C-methyl-D-erythritol kinase [Verrucomicrobia bacterium]|nr:4-(cytidine 5'-diphospho)-2-C-methyl-D-erythritol kinase [Verrucomicrobiota bacterium]